MEYINTDNSKQIFRNFNFVKKASMVEAVVVAEGDVVQNQAREDQLRDEIALLRGELMAAKEETSLIREQLSQWTRLSVISANFAGTAHRIKNSLTAIIAESQLLQTMIDASHPGFESADTISKAGWGVLDVIQKTLEPNENGEQGLEPLQVNDTVESALIFLDAVFSQSNIELEIELADDLPLINGNACQIEELWVNLLLNAHEALPKDKIGKLSIVTRLSLNGMGVEVVVEDNGIGISKENISNIFDPFFSSRIGKGGSGLGLAVCDMVVEQHAGKLSVESEIGKGTTFTINMPLSHKNYGMADMLFDGTTSEKN